MVRQVVWSLRSQNDRKKIFAYWNQRNKSNTYSKKLNSLFKEAVKLIVDYSKIGKQSSVKGVRVKIVRDYHILYEVTETEIHILTIWDSHQDPEKLKEIIKSKVD
jgi:toxin YoeB